MAYTQKINSRNTDNETTFRNEGFVAVSKDPKTNVITYKNPQGEIRYGVPGPKGVVKTLKNKKGETYKG
jgi:hypothetical protein